VYICEIVLRGGRWLSDKQRDTLLIEVLKLGTGDGKDHCVLLHSGRSMSQWPTRHWLRGALLEHRQRTVNCEVWELPGAHLHVAVLEVRRHAKVRSVLDVLPHALRFIVRLGKVGNSQA